MGHKVLRKHPDMVPMMIKPDKCFYSNLRPAAAEQARALLLTGKFAAPRQWSFSQLGQRLRANVGLEAKHAMFMVVAGHVIPPACTQLGQLYDEHKTADGVMEITVGVESTFG